MDNKNKQVIEKIYKHITTVIDYCNDYSDLDSFQNNNMLVEACVFNLMQIGELAKASLTDEFKAQITTIPWKQLYGMRNRIVHGYSGVDMKIVWDTICCDLPTLKTEVEKFLA